MLEVPVWLFDAFWDLMLRVRCLGHVVILCVCVSCIVPAMYGELVGSDFEMEWLREWLLLNFLSVRETVD